MNGMRRRSTLPGRYQPSTIDVLRLNCCVRDGNRWNPQAIATAKGEQVWSFAFTEAIASGRFHGRPAPCRVAVLCETFQLQFALGLPRHPLGARSLLLPQRVNKFIQVRLPRTLTTV